MTTRLLKEITPPFSEANKRKMRALFKTGLGLSRNTSENTLANVIGVELRYLYRYLAQDYNNYIQAENERILAQRAEATRRRAQERRQEQIFTTQLQSIAIRDEITFTRLNKTKVERILRRLIELPDRFIIRYNDKIYTLSDVTKDRLLNDIDTLYVEGVTGGEGSDAELIELIMEINEMTIQKISSNYEFKEGAFFRYTHNMKGLDLSELQIYESVEANNYEDNCFIHALKGQVEEPIIQDCKDMIRGKHTTVKSVKAIAEKHNLYITIRLEDRNYRNYGNKLNRQVKMCLLENHYFKMCDISVNSYALKNYFEICHKDRWNEFYRKDKREKRFIDSYNVVKLLLENKETHLEPISKCDELYKTCYYDDINEIKTLEYSDSNVMLNQYEPREPKDKYLINVFFDFEATTEGDKHIPYLCCIKTGTLKKTFFGSECGRQMLDYLHKYFKQQNLKLIAHNISYDQKFLFDYLSNQSYIKRGSNIMSGQASYYSYGKEQKLKFQDSYSLIPDRLANFGKMFGFTQEKEFIPYGMYNAINVEKRYISDIRKYTDRQVECNNIGSSITQDLYDEYYQKFMENAKKWNCVNNGLVDIIKYAEYYCEIDCEILEKGYTIFKKQIQDVCKLDIDNFVSVASIADTYLMKEGVYEGVYKLGGVVREFIQKCMVGGRTMCADNKKHHVTGKVDDFDATSLYPSAMERLGGYLLGKPKVLQTLDYNVVKNYDGYFIQIKIIKVGINRTFSLMSEITDKGIRMFHNDMVGKTLYVDKTTLEDMLQFQNVEFEIIRGYYYNEERNYKLKEVIQYLFNERLRQKKLGNPIQNIFKLIMNSAYGKTLLKPIDDDVKYVYGEENMMKVVLANYAFIKEVQKIGEDNWEIKLIKSINSHYNNACCGVEVLSMSKRIMNEVMCLSEDKGYNIYYQDTDSMHIDTDNVDLLAKDYKEKYDRELIGKQMGQFHTDFDSDKLQGTIYAKESIFLGKKCYVDVLTDESGKIDYHIRMKGISSMSVKHHAKKDFDNVLELFKHLHSGKEYSFDLTCNGSKACFDMVNMNTIKTKTDFMREVIFLDTQEEKEENKKLKKLKRKK
jgi:hypothetical protein